jgi:hypothetical protein
LDSENAITVAYYEGKSAKFYVNHFAAGVSKFGDPKKITVQHANGRIERPRSILFATIYPTVSKGSVINVGAKEQKKIEQLNKEKKDIDWGKSDSRCFGSSNYYHFSDFVVWIDYKKN